MLNTAVEVPKKHHLSTVPGQEEVEEWSQQSAGQGSLGELHLKGDKY